MHLRQPNHNKTGGMGFLRLLLKNWVRIILVVRRRTRKLAECATDIEIIIKLAMSGLYGNY